jgi:hypothetical protein
VFAYHVLRDRISKELIEEDDIGRYLFDLTIFRIKGAFADAMRRPRTSAAIVDNAHAQPYGILPPC